MTTWIRMTLISLVAVLSSSCATLKSPRGANLQLDAAWVVLPTINNTETPQAGGRMDSILSSLLHIHGVTNLSLVAPSQDNNDLFETADRRQQQDALAQARQQGANYAVAAAVNEWRYKVGLDGEPAVGVSISIIDVASGQVVWSGTAARTGWSREAVSAIAQKATDKLLNDALSNTQ